MEVTLCTEESDFAGRLIGSLRRQKEYEFEVSYYGSVDELLMGKTFCDHLLIDENLYQDITGRGVKSPVTNRVHIICDEKRDLYPRGYIYKYSSAADYVRELIGGIESVSEESEAMILDRKIRLKDDILSSLSRRHEETEEGIYSVIEGSLEYENRLHPMSLQEKERLKKELFNSIRGYDAIQDLLDDDEITEIMINGYNHIFMEKGGRLFESNKVFESKERLMDIINKIVAEANRSVNLASPIVDARLMDGSRVNVVLDPVAINGPIMTIRRFGDKPIGEKELIAYGSLSKECLNFLSKCVKAGYNILISGGTGAGKTTFLNVMSSFIPGDERIITIEDSAELKLKGIRNLVRFEARMETADGVREISIRDLIKTALRCRPDRVIVGEVRSEEAIDMLQALNIGEDGSMSTIHANSAVDALYRLETIVMLSSDIPIKALRRQIASGIDLIVHLGRLRDKSRRVLEIVELLGIKNDEIRTQTLYSFEETGEDMGKVIGELKKQNELFHIDKLTRAGISYEL